MVLVEVEDVLTSTSIENALSANMGRVLNNSIESLNTRVSALESGTSGGGSCGCSLVIW